MTLSINACSQKNQSQTTLIQLEDLMNSYVSELNDVTHYTLTIKDSILDKETHLDGGESHHKLYDISNAEFRMSEYEIEPEAREFFDFIVYWDIYISDDWIATEIHNKEDAEKIILLLKKLKTELK